MSDSKGFHGEVRVIVCGARELVENDVLDEDRGKCIVNDGEVLRKELEVVESPEKKEESKEKLKYNADITEICTDIKEHD